MPVSTVSLSKMAFFDDITLLFCLFSLFRFLVERRSLEQAGQRLRGARQRNFPTEAPSPEERFTATIIHKRFSGGIMNTTIYTAEKGARRGSMKDAAES